MALVQERGTPVTRRRPGIGPRLSRVNIGVWRALVGLVLIALWTVVALSLGGNFIPTPFETARAAVQIVGDGALLWAVLHTLVVFVCGYVIAAAVAIPLGLVMGGFRVLGAALEPYVDALSAMPRVSFIPLIIVFLGLGYEAKICIVFLGAIMPMLINTYAGVLNSDADLIEMARAAGARDGQIFLKIMLPGALPYIVAGLRVGAALALINTVVAELYTAVSGLGGLLSIYGNSFRMAPYFVVVILLAVIGLATMQSLKFCERRLMRHRARA
jgi:NitT/TauT family transport system permease protein